MGSLLIVMENNELCLLQGCNTWEQCIVKLIETVNTLSNLAQGARGRLRAVL